MLDILTSQFGTVIGSKRAVLEYLYGHHLNKSEFYKRPLSKLTRDVLELCYTQEIDWQNI